LAATSEELTGQAEQLQQSVAFFKIGDDVPVLRGGVRKTLPSNGVVAVRLERRTGSVGSPRLSSNFKPY
jgi:hypothetical protein